MNTSLVDIVKRIIAEEGEAVLADPKRLGAKFKVYAQNEPKDDRVAFGRCVEFGAYRELKQCKGEDERRRKKVTLASQMAAKTGLPKGQCADALDVLDAAAFGASVTTGAQGGTSNPLGKRTIAFGVAGALGGIAGELLGTGVFLGGSASASDGEDPVGMMFRVGTRAALVGLSVAVALLVAQSVFLKKRPTVKSFLKTGAMGAVLGGIAACLAQAVYSSAQEGSGAVEAVSGALGWGVMGAGIGLAVSTCVPNFPKGRAIAAGFLGGTIGGTLFGALGMVDGIPDAVGRLVGFPVLGMFIGMTISYIEEALRDAWITVIYGPKERRTVALGKQPIVFGSAPESHIYLAKEPPTRALVEIEGGEVVMHDKQTGKRQVLHNGEQVSFGKIAFVVSTEEA